MDRKDRLLRSIFAPLIHNKKHSHEISIFNVHLRLCARCTGIALGFLTALSVGLLVNLPFALGALHPGIIVAFSLVLAFPMLADWTSTKVGWRTGDNHTRMVSGGFLGAGLVFLLSASLPGHILIGIPMAIVLGYMCPVMLLAGSNDATEKDPGLPSRATVWIPLILVLLISGIAV